MSLMISDDGTLHASAQLLLENFMRLAAAEPPPYPAGAGACSEDLLRHSQSLHILYMFNPCGARAPQQAGPCVRDCASLNEGCHTLTLHRAQARTQAGRVQ
jgi:hypothetical protein